METKSTEMTNMPENHELVQLETEYRELNSKRDAIVRQLSQVDKAIENLIDKILREKLGK